MFTALDWPGFADLSLAGLLFLCAAAFLAGAVDAIVGGGGLIQLPAMLLLVPGGEVIYSLATSKIAAVAGTTAAAHTYARKTPIDWRSALPMALVALLGSLGGAMFADALPSSVLNIVVLVALVLVGIYTWRKPDLGTAHAPRFQARTQVLVMIAGGAVIGFWDGIAGPGTGSFLVFLLVGLVGFAFVAASATSKIVNVATNVGALVFFIPAGKVLWGLGVLMAVSNITGSVLGALVASRRGSAFVRRVFLTVVVGLVASLGWKLALGG
ncbi:TSUP family transporter [Saccharopolyspora erythraea]|uniref:sulfite exporter TauE/SafE family protein n=1 Tax=Saccharopolyspora erythraea TaxID=1836 RepID=UPI001BA8558C|nr:TSUP family transporter [Saccharopolyspora erythraea]QUH01036.1 TSUP family transporter [Saccharopolyspora erythraea]